MKDGIYVIANYTLSLTHVCDVNTSNYQCNLMVQCCRDAEKFYLVI